MKLVATRRTDYGIRALLYLAREPGTRVKAAEISRAMDIPQGFLHQVLQELQRARLVDSRPSRHGGYRLAAAPDDVSVLDVVEALEGPLETGECALRGGPCQPADACVLHGVWSGAHEALRRELGAATLAHLVDGGERPELFATPARGGPGAVHPHPLLAPDGDGDGARRADGGFRRPARIGRLGG